MVWPPMPGSARFLKQCDVPGFAVGCLLFVPRSKSIPSRTQTGRALVQNRRSPFLAFTRH